MAALWYDLGGKRHAGELPAHAWKIILFENSIRYRLGRIQEEEAGIAPSEPAGGDAATKNHCSGDAPDTYAMKVLQCEFVFWDKCHIDP